MLYIIMPKLILYPYVHSIKYIPLLAPPQPPVIYYNLTIEKLNQPVILNCSVSAVPRPRVSVDTSRH